MSASNGTKAGYTYSLTTCQHVRTASRRGTRFVFIRYAAFVAVDFQCSVTLRPQRPQGLTVMDGEPSDDDEVMLNVLRCHLTY